ncbi:VOC family protein [Bacillus sp. JJ1122]|uniref:VOC family protein n=1 Tax=Bacillus sp. JJ1122 TaxID=3122951 RepID=UPI002FFE33AA
MIQQLLRVGTIYIPVNDVEVSSEWYAEKLNAEISYQDDEKAIINLANMSFFLVKSMGQSANFVDILGEERFILTFEVNGIKALAELHNNFLEKGLRVGEIEDRGHAGNNFVFYDLDGNMFDVWSELSPDFKKRYLL